ncbi:hypothetical protein [Pseudonocardia sp.]|uniref:hypothetical protein n=1 Tax=Pseudonocardia sp. TaxID=60912 RepID=UPI002F42858C
MLAGANLVLGGRVNAMAEAAAPPRALGRYLAAFAYAFTVAGVLAPGSPHCSRWPGGCPGWSSRSPSGLRPGAAVRERPAARPRVRRLTLGRCPARWS